MTCHCKPHDEESRHGHSAASAGNAALRDGTQTVLRVSGMCCSHEVRALEEALGALPGVGELRVNLVEGKATVYHDASVTAGALVRAVASTGMQAVPEGDGGEIKETKRARLIAVGISGAALAAGLLLQWTQVSTLAADVALAVAIIAGGWFVVPKAWLSLRRWTLDMNVLMSVAILGALAIHEWPEGAAVAFLFALSELLEAFSLARARHAVRALMKLTPETAWVKDEAGFREVPVEQVRTGATIAVKSGARIPLDGVVTAGESAVDQAPITGESMPVEKAPGDTVFAGTINGPGSLEIRTSRGYTNTAIARIIHLVEEAQSHKAPSQRFVDTFARYYTPAVMAAALLVMLVPPLTGGGAWADWFYRGLVMLVIACPCALVISTPVSIVSGLTSAARRGVLIKGGAVLESVGKLTALAVDKTGTITEGAPRVTAVIPVNSTSEAEILRIAAAIDVHSEHPLALAVVRRATELGIDFPRGEAYQARAGRGADAVVDGHAYFVGNHRYTHEIAVCSPEIERLLAGAETEAQSVVVVGHRPHDDCRGEVLGILAVGDSIRKNAGEAIAALHRTGIRKIVMLSGDNQRTASAIAAKVGIDVAKGDLLPEQKIEEVRALQSLSHHVGMVGDGVNDAPAMAAAAVGIAMGAGTDTALETADMALVQNDLGKVAETVRLGRRTVRLIQCNIGFALAVKAVFLAAAISGHATLWLAVVADTGAALLVVANALRLLRP